MKSKVRVKKNSKPEPPIKRLYVATQKYEVVFVSSSGHGLKHKAEEFIEEQNKTFQPSIEVQEITCKEEIPEDWREDYTLIWGSDEEMNAEQFLESKKTSEYQEYLRLKAKFRDKE